MEGDADDDAWEVVYSGGHSGEVSGSIIVVVGGPFTTAIAAGDLDEPLRLQTNTLLVGEETGPTRLIPFSVDLADGTECGSIADEPVEGTVSNGGPDGYAVDFAGSLDCDGVRIEVEGFVRKQP